MANPGPASSNNYSPEAAIGNVAKIGVFNISITPTATTASGTSVQNFAATGIGLIPSAAASAGVNAVQGDQVAVAYQAAQTAGVAIGDCYVSAADTLTIRFINATAGTPTPAAGVYTVTVMRPIQQSSQSVTNPQLSW